MSYYIKCPDCGIKIDIDDDLTGEKVQCFSCETKFIIKEVFSVETSEAPTAATPPKKMSSVRKTSPLVPKKSTPIPLIVVLIVLGVGGFFGYKYIAGQKKDQDGQDKNITSDNGAEDAKSATRSSKTVPVPKAEKKLLPISDKDYSYAWWLNGWRKYVDDKTDDLLCFESGYYGFMLDIGKIAKPRFGLFNDDVDALKCLELGSARMKKLPKADLDVSLEVDGKTYRMVGCKAATAPEEKNLAFVRLWEAGNIAQHYDVLDLKFQDEAGNSLGCSAKLDMVVWPESLTFNLEMSPDLLYKDGPGMGVVGSGLCIVEKPLDIPHKPEMEPDKITVEMWYLLPENMTPPFGWLLCKNGNEWQPGNYGFGFMGNGVNANMNIADGRMKQTNIRQHGFLVKGKWNHLALTYDGNKMAFYLNGHCFGIKEVGKARVKGNDILRIGKRADGHGNVIPGLYDQIRIWNRPLTDAEIKAHSKEPAKIPNKEGLVFEENFDGKGKIELPVWKDAKMAISLKGKNKQWQTEQVVKGPWEVGTKKTLTLNCDVTGRKVENKDISMQLSINKQKFPVTFDKERNCYVSEVRKVKRDWKPGYEPLRHYDEFNIVIDNKGKAEENIPFNLLFYGPGSITGLCPILADKDGVPTGIFVQLSKNWHYVPWGGYFFPYMLLPAKPGKTEYKLRIAYGFYGKVPPASHAQLSLVGYGGNGRWDQLAVGAWGESICFDPDMSLTDGFVTDIRGLMFRNGLKGKKWGWTDAGWGADWLVVNDKHGRRFRFNDPKVSYLAHGPCLTDVIYDGYMGENREVDLYGRIMLPRTDDYCRTFQDLKYKFLKPVSADKSYFYRMGKNNGHAMGLVAYGNEKGVIADMKVPVDAKVGDKLADQLTLSGKGPWWVSFPDSIPNSHVSMGADGNRALIIRSYKAVIGGKTYTNPTINLPIQHIHKPGIACVELFIVPPKGVTEFKPGDSVELDVEFVTQPREADDYYGPNETFRKFMAGNPKSWKPVYREAKENDLKVKVEGGKLLRNLPIIIQAESREIKVDITGGVGYVPIRFDGLNSKDFFLYQVIDGQEKKLDQTAQGNDFWQTDYDPITNSFRMTFNVPLDNVKESKWVLKAGGR